MAHAGWHHVPRSQDLEARHLPLAPYADDVAFKLFLADVGLLGAMAGLVAQRGVLLGRLTVLDGRQAGLCPVWGASGGFFSPWFGYGEIWGGAEL